MRKRIVAILIACMCIGTVAPYTTVYAAETPEVSMETEEAAEDVEEASEESEDPVEMVFPTGLIQPEVKDAGTITSEEFYDEVEAENEIMLYSSQYESEWDSYSNNYIYNFLSEDERAYWDSLDAVCLQLLLGTDNALNRDGNIMTNFVSCDGLTTDEAKTLAYIFKYSNPQYYFLSVTLWSGTYGTESYIALGIYPAFEDGSARQTATQTVKAQVDTWAATANSCSTEAEKVKVIHDLIVNKVAYLYGSFNEDTAYTQTAYSVFCMDETVCAGYAQAFEWMCNAVGVDCITVTSSDHQWNKVRINDSWYNVDCTWDDQSTIYYNYFERSDAVYDSDSYASSHAEESFWSEYLPTCTLDSGASYTNPGTLPTITQTTANPVITYTASSNGYTTTISSTTPNSIIYYTLDGTEPTPSYTRAYRYDGAFTVSNNTTVKALAVCDTYWDSSVVSKVASGGSTGGTDSGTTGGTSGGSTGGTDSGSTGGTDSGTTGGTSGGTDSGTTGGTDSGTNEGVSSNSVTGKSRFVALLYENVLERNAKQSEIAYWVQELENGKTGAEVAYGFLFSQEFINKNLSNGDYVERLYMSMMGRASDSAGKTDWVTHLNNGVSRLYVFKQFVDSDEFGNLCSEYGIIRGNVTLGEARDMNYNVTRFVARNYTQFLGRDYDVDGLNDWSSRINNHTQSMQEIAAGFVFSQECTNKNLSNEEYVKMLYRGCFDREGEGYGVTYWVEYLEAGTMSREDVFWGFANSQEFANMVSSYGV